MKTIKFSFLAGIVVLTMSSIPLVASAQGSDRDRSGSAIASSPYQISQRNNNRNNRSQIEAEIGRYYQQILGRNPDSNGLRNYADAVQDNRMSLEQVRNEITNSPEARNRGYNNNNRNDNRNNRNDNRNNRNNRSQIEDQISRYYQQFLGRNPDSNGLKNYADAVQDNRMSLDQVRNEIANSPEARNSGYNNNNYNWNNRSQIEDQISRYYQQILGRNADSNGLKNYADAVQNNQMSLDQVRNEISNSPEARARNR
jgi:uncharacterized protein YbcI